MFCFVTFSCLLCLFVSLCSHVFWMNTVTSHGGDAQAQVAGGPDSLFDIRKFDGIVCISGDGLLYECLQVRPLTSSLLCSSILC